MRTRDALAFVAAMGAVTLLWNMSSSVAEQAPSEIGRYQMATDFKQDGFNRIFVTVIDTTTGEVVRRERHDPGDYD